MLYKEEGIPLRCPLHSICKKSANYKLAVSLIKRNGTYFLNHQEEMWNFAESCPHKLEDGFWTGAIGKQDWVRYQCCDTFSKWFWERKAASRKGQKKTRGKVNP